MPEESRGARELSPEANRIGVVLEVDMSVKDCEAKGRSSQGRENSLVQTSSFLQYGRAQDSSVLENV